MKNSRVVLLVAVLAAVSGGIVLSGAGEAKTTGQAPPAVGEIRPVSSGKDIVLPFSEYVNSAAEVNTIERASALLAKDCMARFGLEWTVSGAAAADATVAADGGRYGILDAAEVAVWGYHAPAESKKVDDGRPTPSPDALMVYGGKGASTFRGQAVPEGGCLGEGRRKLSAGGPTSMSGAEFSNLDLQLFSTAQKDSRVAELMIRWRECMSEAGYDYADVWAANNDIRWSGPTATAEEIATATKDIACRTKTELVPVWLAVETAYQRQAIAERPAEFAALKASKQQWIDNASQAVR